MVAQAKLVSTSICNANALSEGESLQHVLGACNRRFEKMNAAERVDWSLENLPGTHIVSSSFGAQSAVMLHMLTTRMPDIPVVLIDTGYLFPETYRFVDELTERLRLNLKVFRAEQSPAWQEARHGHRWKQGEAGLDSYNLEVKVEPMKRALEDLSTGTWFSGLRRSQSGSREDAPFILRSGSRWKIHAIADWSDRDVHRYLARNDLPYHPLWEHGYVSIGDYHTTKALHEVTDAEQTRFFGIKRECGIHEIELSKV